MSIMPQINHHDPFAPIVRRASAPAPQTHASRQSVGTHAGLHREDVPSTTQEQKPKRTGYDGVPLTLRRRQLVSAEDDVPEEEEEAYDDEWPTRLPSSARRYVQPLAGTRYQAHADHVIPRRRGQANRATQPQGDLCRSRRPTHPGSSPPKKHLASGASALLVRHRDAADAGSVGRMAGVEFLVGDSPG